MSLRKGEFKTPGGKLIAVDFAVADGKLKDVQVHGDFFLEPDDALDAITKSLDGAPESLSKEALTQRISASLPEGTEWHGSSPEALAQAVRRGIEDRLDDIGAGGGDRGFS